MNRITHKEGVFQVEGQIDEFVDYKIFDGVARPLKLDLSRVKNVNSLGVREFLKFIKKEAPHGIEFHRCSAAVMDMINSIPSSLGSPSHPEIVRSIVLDYCCVSCVKEEAFLLEVKPGSGLSVPVFPSLACSRCNAPMQPSIGAEDLFTYLIAAD